MRRTFVLLALLLAGAASAAPAGVASGAGGTRADHGLRAGDAPVTAAFLPGGMGSLSVVWQEGAGPSPNPLSRRLPVLLDGREPGRIVASRLAGFRARRAAHRGYSTPLALSRAGLPAFTTATPPPFRFV